MDDIWDNYEGYRAATARWELPGRVGGMLHLYPRRMDDLQLKTLGMSCKVELTRR